MRYFFLIVGIIFLLLGIIGIFLPLLPTTPFLILTAMCFHKGSPRFHAWLINHRIFGPPIQDWQKHKVIRIQYKVLATVMMGTSSFFVVTKDTIPVMGKSVFGVFIFLMLLFIWSRRSSK